MNFRLSYAHPTTLPDSRFTLRSSLLAAGVAVLVAAGAAALLGRVPLNLYDVSFSLDWGSQLFHGRLPDVRVPGASTPHPLSIVSGGVAALFGTQALDAMQGMVMAAAGVVVVSLLAIGRAARLTSAGVLAVAGLGLSAPLVSDALEWATASDLPALAAVFAALALEVERPRRGMAPLMCLAVAGMWRPEAWLLSAAYFLYVASGRERREIPRLAVVAASAPLVWMTCDWLLTGNPVYSLTYTQTATQLAQRPSGLAQVPAALWETLSSYLDGPLLAGAALGLLLDLRLKVMPRLVTVALVLTLLGFLAIGVAGLPLDARYALPSVLLVSVFYGFFLVGWRGQRRGWLRRVWLAGALAVAALAAIGVPSDLRTLDANQRALTAQAIIPRALQQLVRRPDVRGLVARCGPIRASYRIVPLLAYALGRNPRTLTVNDRGVPDRGLVLEPVSALAAQLFETHTHPVASFTERGYAISAANAHWMLYSRCRAATPPATVPA